MLAHFSIFNHSESSSLSASVKSFFQPKFFINQPNDVFEKEADAVAENIMQPSTGQSFFSPSVIQRKEEINYTSATQAGNFTSSLQGGKPLGSEERSFFESGMNYDFSNVRIYNDSDANQSAKNIHALAYTHGNDIVFNDGQYKPNTHEGKKLIAHELTHVIQQSRGITTKIQTKRELNTVTEKDQYTKCLEAIDNVLKKLEANAYKQGMPDDIKEAIKLLRKKFTENKIKCYYLDGITHGITNFTTGEIYMDAKLLKDTTDVCANIGEGNLLHEGIHALHKEKFPASTKKYGKTLDEKDAGKNSNLSDAEIKDLQKLDAWTEYWGYRKMREYNNVVYNQGKDDDTIHAETLKRMREEGGIAPLNVVWAFDPKWDPRKWKPKN